MNTSATVPCKFVRSLLRFLETQGCDMPAIREAVQLPFNPLEKRYSGEEPIPGECYGRLYQWAMWMVQDESFGLCSAGVRPLGTFRMMSYALINCRNLEHAMNRAADFNEILKASRDPQPFTRRRPSHHPQGWPVRRVAMDDGSVSAVQYYDTDLHSSATMDEAALLGIASGMSIWHRFCSWLIDTPIELEAVMFTAEQPKQFDRYQQFFNCTLLFNQPENGFRFSAGYLDYPILQTEDSLHQFLRNAPLQLVRMPNHGKSVVSQIRSLIGHDVGRKFPSFEDIAAKLNQSPTTLRRRLQREGMAYQQIKDDCRRDVAMGYLARPELSITAVAALLGFTDVSSFHRSFKKWTGNTPSEFRERAGVLL